MESQLATTSVDIRSFQSIDELRFDIAGFTCITGPSNIGKSAIIRAISGALLNSPATHSVRKGRKFCSVDLKGPGWGVKWEKGDRIGRYWVPGEDSARDGIGQGQTEITSSLGFRSIKIGDDKLSPWLAPQFDPIFLLNKSGPSITDFISDITRLKVLQDAIVLNVRARQRVLTEASAKEEDIAKLQATEARLAPVDGLLGVEKDLVGQMESVREYERSIERITEIQESLEREGGSIRALSGVKRVVVPDAVPEPHIAHMVGIWAGLEAAALSVFKVRLAPTVQVPDALDGDGISRLRGAVRFLDIDGLRASVERLGSISSVAVPDAAEERDVARLREAESFRTRISVAERAVARLSGETAEVPDAGEEPDFQRLTAAAATARALDAERGTVAALELELGSLGSRLSDVEAELAKIPTCPACGQVVARSHDHPA